MSVNAEIIHGARSLDLAKHRGRKNPKEISHRAHERHERKKKNREKSHERGLTRPSRHSR